MGTGWDILRAHSCIRKDSVKRCTQEHRVQCGQGRTSLEAMAAWPDATRCTMWITSSRGTSRLVLSMPSGLGVEKGFRVHNTQSQRSEGSLVSRRENPAPSVA